MPAGWAVSGRLLYGRRRARRRSPKVAVSLRNQRVDRRVSWRSPQHQRFAGELLACLVDGVDGGEWVLRGDPKHDEAVPPRHTLSNFAIGVAQANERHFWGGDGPGHENRSERPLGRGTSPDAMKARWKASEEVIPRFHGGAGTAHQPPHSIDTRDDDVVEFGLAEAMQLPGPTHKSIAPLGPSHQRSSALTPGSTASAGRRPAATDSTATRVERLQESEVETHRRMHYPHRRALPTRSGAEGRSLGPLQRTLDVQEAFDGLRSLLVVDGRDGDQPWIHLGEREEENRGRRRRAQGESVRIAAACAGTLIAYTPLALGLTSVRLGVPVS